MRKPVIAAVPGDVADATVGALTIGLVPVMGALHAGHLSLIRRSDLENDETVVAIFDPNADTPVVSENDIRMAWESGARIFYLPEPETIFPCGFATRMYVDGLDDRFEGEFRPGRSGRTVAYFTILLNQLQPTRTYVGEKHLQRLALLRRIHEDLSLAGEIVACPTVRDPDGLPLSSYNAHLTPEDREASLAIPNALFAMQRRAVSGERDADTLLTLGHEIIAAQPAVTLQYLAIVDPDSFEPAGTVVTGSRVIAAAMVGNARIIDNIHLAPGGLGHTDDA